MNNVLDLIAYKNGEFLPLKDIGPSILDFGFIHCDATYDVKAGRKKIAYGIGIGYPQADKERWQTDETELAIGAGNGDTLTTLNEKDPNWVDKLSSFLTFFLISLFSNLTVYL